MYVDTREARTFQLSVYSPVRTNTTWTRGSRHQVEKCADVEDNGTTHICKALCSIVSNWIPHWGIRASTLQGEQPPSISNCWLAMSPGSSPSIQLTLIQEGEGWGQDYTVTPFSNSDFSSRILSHSVGE